MRDEFPDELPDELTEHAHYIEGILVGVEDAILTHRIHPDRGPQLVIVAETALDLIDLGRSLECAGDQLLGFAVEQDNRGRFHLIVDTTFLDSAAA